MARELHGIEFSHTIFPGRNEPPRFIEVIHPPGISKARKNYLYKHIRPYCKDLMCSGSSICPEEPLGNNPEDIRNPDGHFSIWLMPKYAQYGAWPASGEIDIMESRGNSDLVSSAGVNIGNQMIASTLHFGPRWNNDKWSTAHFEKSNASGYNSSFHNYQLEWTDSYLKFSVDDVEIGTVTPSEGGFWELGSLNSSGVENPWRYEGNMAPFNEQFYIIINLAVGGTNYYFPDDATNGLGDKPWINSSPTAYTDFWNGKDTWEPTWNMSTENSHFQIDYVKVWAI